MRINETMEPTSEVVAIKWLNEVIDFNERNAAYGFEMALKSIAFTLAKLPKSESQLIEYWQAAYDELKEVALNVENLAMITKATLNERYGDK